ncbi:MAG: thermostable hemolysin [Rhodospirillales bacterium]|nr:thermostable hemolysin [Alphaproteobacteria bacterium]MCB9977478.1 thermostable hemolysin [Rhodospirillales bacterium]
MQTIRIFQDSSEAGRLRLNSKAMGPAGRLKASVIDISPSFAPQRGRVETFIRQIYENAYGADIDILYPTLMSVRTSAGEILAGIGFRYASEEPLFLERYTKAPIEETLSVLYNKDICRSQIVEIGNLASIGKGASIYLFAALSSYLHARGIDFATVTGTDFLQKRFHRLGLQPQRVCSADPELLTEEERRRWGSYYDTKPGVLTGSVGNGVHHLKKALGVVYEEQPGISLFSRLHFKKSFSS